MSEIKETQIITRPGIPTTMVSHDLTIDPPHNPLFLFPGDLVDFDNRTCFIIDSNAMSMENDAMIRGCRNLYSSYFHRYTVMTRDYPQRLFRYVHRRHLKFIERKNWMPTYTVYSRLYATLISTALQYEATGLEAEIDRPSPNFIIPMDSCVFGVERTTNENGSPPNVFVVHGRIRERKFRTDANGYPIPNTEEYVIGADGYGSELMALHTLKLFNIIPDDWDIYCESSGRPLTMGGAS